MRVLLVAITLILLACNAEAATIEGYVYSWENFEPLKDVIITINTTPQQRIVSQDGSYSFQVTPGVYEIQAYHYNDITLYANETVVVKEEGTYRIDLLAVPLIEEIEKNLNESLNIDFELENAQNVKENGTSYNYYILTAIVTVLAFSAFIYIRIMRKSVRYEEKTDSRTEDIPEDLMELIEIIRRNGGRITQKELKKKTGYSDAKISLMISDLERRGIVEKVKKGRGNVIFLKE